MANFNLDITLTQVQESINTNEVYIDVVLNQVQPIEIIIDQAIMASQYHNLLGNLDYANSGHTGFASDDDVVKVFGDQAISGEKTFEDKLKILNNLDINGFISNENTDVMEVGNPFIKLNSRLPSSEEPSTDAGVEVNRGIKNDTGIYFRELQEHWTVDDKKIVIDGDTLDGGSW